VGFFEDLERVRQDLVLRRLAQVRAGDRELAEDALQQTYWNVARVTHPETIRDLRAFFCRALINEIGRLLPQSVVTSVEDIVPISDREQMSTSSARAPSPDVEGETCSQILAKSLLARLESDRSFLETSVPGRSANHERYRSAILAAAASILCLLFAGHVTNADWSTVLKGEYPEYLDEPGRTRNAIDHRLSRARRDVVDVVKQIISRGESPGELSCRANAEPDPRDQSVMTTRQSAIRFSAHVEAHYAERSHGVGPLRHEDCE
jgi:hypothetical protein